MNIILFPDTFLPVTGGLELAVAHLADELKMRGHTITIITGRWPSTLPAREKYKEINIFRMRFKPPSLNPIKCILFLTLGCLSFSKLFILFLKIKPDIVNIHFLGHNAFYALMISVITRVRIVTHLHGSDITVRAVSQPWFRFLDLVVLKASTKIVSNSYDLLLQTERLYGKWVRNYSHVIGNGVTIEKFKQIVNKERYTSKKIVSIGRLDRIKGHDVLICAMIKIVKYHPTSKLIIIGDGPERKTLTEIVKRQELEQSVEFRGRIPNMHIPDILESAAVYVQPSRKEAFGISVIEAMAAYTPVVATRTGGLPELVINKRNGLLVAVDHVDEIAEAIIYLIERPEESEKMGIAGRVMVEKNYTWDSIVQNYIEVLKGACKPMIY